jgi:hypothetical protein
MLMVTSTGCLIRRSAAIATKGSMTGLPVPDCQQAQACDESDAARPIWLGGVNGLRCIDRYRRQVLLDLFPGSASKVQ